MHFSTGAQSYINVHAGLETFHSEGPWCLLAALSEMRSVLLIFCLSSVAVRVSAHVSPVADSFKACLAESGMTRGIARLFLVRKRDRSMGSHKFSFLFLADDFIKALQSSDDSKAQCIAACTMEKENFMSDEKINIDAIIAKMEDVSQEIGKVQITNLVKNCAAEAKDRSGKCGVAHSVVRCIHDELRKEGWI
ncbi:hypothetical protein TSAR_002875 [Trichomalopsis sarcophagae]|uniref:Uncharacterized protein n=1 Tax=Trichomalopsis sarcophagae TaxID=543379 RepID=A0A232EUI3_9HYME|nr:hypothetical protein TSAR_002875 [Trichomalopsis sarcophagae]